MKARMFIGTLNNPDTSACESIVQAWVCKAKAVYCTGQLEKGAEGTPHLQFYVHFAEQRRITALRKHLACHYQPVGVNNGADDYCNKEETRIEGPWSAGIKPAKLNKKGDKARKTKELLAMGPEKALEEGLVALGKQYLDLVKATEMYNLRKAEAVSTDTCRGIYYWGPSGTGKSHTARQIAPDAYIKDQSKWWDGYTGQSTVILDDLDSDCLSHHLKIWLDKYPCFGEFKGGKTALQHTKFIITSNYSIETLFGGKGDDLVQAIRRRCEVHHFENPFPKQ